MYKNDGNAAKKRILVTGSMGFIGKNLLYRLKEREQFEVLEYTRADGLGYLKQLVNESDLVVHLAGENRPHDQSAYEVGNKRLTEFLVDCIREVRDTRGEKIKLIFASSTQATLDNLYGKSKRDSEKAILKLDEEAPGSCCIFRFPGLFGKWSKPNYNSVVATFCHNVARGLPIEVHDEYLNLRLMYIDDVVNDIMGKLLSDQWDTIWGEMCDAYEITLADLAKKIAGFHEKRTKLFVGQVGTGIDRALYATYLSFLPTDEKFKYTVPIHADKRGIFVEMIKSENSGQISYFTAGPGITRGGHYHHTKSEKFLVVSGEARFRCRHLITEETIVVFVKGSSPEVVETIPGWVHDITNVGETELMVVVWANEVFNPCTPDTFTGELGR